MEGSLEQRLKAAEEYTRTLEENFRNNLQVIEEQEQEIEILNSRVAELEHHTQVLEESITRQEEQAQLEIRLIRSECQLKIE